MVRVTLTAALLLATRIAAGYLVSPSGTAFPGASSSCSEWVSYSEGLTCAKIEATYGITEAQFLDWNPLLSEIFTDCDVLSGYDYCVDIDFETFTTSSSSTTSSYSTSSALISSSATTLVTSTVPSSKVTQVQSNTTVGDGVSTPSPIQTGLVSTCDEFYLVVSGDTCAAIASNHSISLANFYAWNPAVGSSCAYLDLGDYVCVNVIGNTVTSSVLTTTTSTSTIAISTPSPIQTGMASTCDEFYQVVSGDSCSGVASDYGITLADFYAWNPAVGSSCAYLDVGDYVCVNVIGNAVTSSAFTTTTSTSTSTTAISTPSPIQTGMISTCDEFYMVASGDSCSGVASDYGITLADFYAWNPAVGSSCAYLDVGDYVCVNVAGSGTTTTATTATITTSTATSTTNAVTTPSPIQTGMATDCDAFYFVVSGDSCASIAEAEDVTVDDLEEWNPAIGSDCTDLWLDTYICVGVY
ncbi:hypothetical protein N7528_010081 [Penicillium herquei]|nr:hypothetical protein N7528_010081 [Penicillium herquei]